MVTHEHAERKKRVSMIHARQKSELDEISRQLELNDTNENFLERYFKRDELLDQQALLHAEIDTTNDTSE